MSVGGPLLCQLDEARANTKLFKTLQLTAMHVMQKHYDNPLLAWRAQSHFSFVIQTGASAERLDWMWLVL